MKRNHNSLNRIPLVGNLLVVLSMIFSTGSISPSQMVLPYSENSHFSKPVLAQEEQPTQEPTQTIPSETPTEEPVVVPTSEPTLEPSQTTEPVETDTLIEGLGFNENEIFETSGIAITSDNPDPSIVDTTYAVSATVAGSFGTPTGSIIIDDGEGANCFAVLVDGSASCDLTSTSDGVKTLTANYSGDETYAASSDTEAHTVNKNTSSTMITSDDPDPSQVNQSYTVGLTVSGSAGMPTGTVNINDGEGDSCIATLVDGSGSCELTSASSGVKTLTANYSGDETYNGSSVTEAHTVNKNTSTTMITSDDPDPNIVNQSYTVMVTVSGSAGMPTGTVNIDDGGGANCIAILVDGLGSCELTSASSGVKTLTANYSGDETYNGSSVTEAHTVNKNTSTTMITSDDPDPNIVNQSYTVMVTVSGSAGMPTGTVNIDDGGGANCIAILVDGLGSCELTSASSGVKTLTANYSGDETYNGSSVTEAHTVNKNTSTTMITSDDPDPNIVNQSYTVMVTVSGSAGMPTGTVNIDDGGGANCIAILVDGSGSCELTSASSGEKMLTANYSGDETYNGSSETDTHLVNDASIRDSYEEDGTCGGAKTITSGEQQTRSIVPAGESDWVTFTLSRAADVTLETSGPGGDTVMYLYKSDCTTLIAWDDDNGIGYFSLITESGLAAGTYYVLVVNLDIDTEIIPYYLNYTSVIIYETSTTTITSDEPDPSTAGQDYTVTVMVSGSAGTPTGSVSVSDGEGGGCTITSLSGGSGSCSMSSYSAAVKALTAIYSGDGVYYGSSATESHSVIDSYEEDGTCVQAKTIISGEQQTRSIVPAGDSDWVMFTVSQESDVTLETSGPGGDTVMHLYGNNCTTLIDSDDNDGAGNFSLITQSGLAAGTYYVLVSNYDNETEIIPYYLNYTSVKTRETSTITITSDEPDPSTAGQDYTVTVMVSGSAGTPTGSVSVSDGEGGGCTITSLSGGSGSCSMSSFSAAVNVLTAIYSGDGIYYGSSDTEAHTVNKITSTTTITSDDPDPSLLNESYMVGVNVSGSAGTPTGSVSVSDGESGGCTIGNLSGGSGSCSMSSSSAGEKTLTAIYSGNGTYATSSDAEEHTVNKNISTTTITSDNPDPSRESQSYSVAVTVTGSAGTATGSVIVSDGEGGGCAIGSLSAGSGSCIMSSSSLGEKTLTAIYSGNIYYLGSNGTGSHMVMMLPEMDVKGNSVSITSGDSTPSLSDHTYFGAVSVASGTLTRTFTIYNIGDANLNLIGSPMVVVGGINAADFSVSTQPVSPLAPSGSTPFTVVCDPSAAGLRTATLSIANDDNDEHPYSFSIQCAGAQDLTPPKPAVPQLVSPLTGSATNDYTPELSWASAINASSYEVEIGRDSAFRSVIYNKNTGLTQILIVPEIADGKYFWRVKALNSMGVSSSWSAARSITIDTAAPPAPVLSLPAANAAVVGTPTFSWLAASGANAYQFEYDNDSDFGSPTYTSPVLTVRTHKPPTMMDPGIYYWHVRSRDAAGNWSESWSPARTITITPPKPAAPGLVSPLNNSATNDTTPTFSWNSVPYGATYQIQISKLLTFSTLVDSYTGSELSYTPPSTWIDAKYYWRVRAYNSTGVVYSSWSTARSVTIDTAAPPAPVLSLPAANAAVVGTPTFSWLAASGANAYQFEYDNDSDFGSPTYTSPVLTVRTHKPPTMMDPGIYYWHVRSRDAAGNWSESWSPARTITITPPKPAAPGLVSPLNNSATNDTTPTFSWNSVPYGATYQIQISKLLTFSTLVDSYTGSELSYTPPSTWIDAKYYWRVRAYNSTGVVYSSWSTARSVTIDTAAPPAPVLSLPAANAAVVGTPTFSWLAASGANAYQFEYDNDSDFGSPTYTSPVLTVRTHKPPTMMDPGIYYWHVRSRDAAGNWSESWSPARTITITPPKPAAPGLVSPLNNSATNDTTPTFSWNSVPYGATYQIQISKLLTFSTLVDSYTGSELSYTPPSTWIDAKYYWRVRAYNSTGVVYSSWSTARSVTIDTAAPPAPVLSLPAANAAVVGTPTFSWLAASGANAYQFEYDNDPGFDSHNYTSAVLTTLTHKPPVMALGTYFWRVRSRDAAGNWSESWSPARMITIGFL